MQTTEHTTTGEAGRGSVGEMARLALKLGFTAFGGPAAHIAMLRDEVVNRRKWLTDAYFMIQILKPSVKIHASRHW